MKLDDKARELVDELVKKNEDIFTFKIKYYKMAMKGPQENIQRVLERINDFINKVDGAMYKLGIEEQTYEQIMAIQMLSIIQFEKGL